MQQIDTDITILKALENVGALTANFGLYDIKPFKDWPGSKWENSIFTFRLLNTGEMLGVLRKVSNEFSDAKEQYKRLEILAHAIWSVEGRSLATEEDVVTYNTKNNTSLTQHEFIVNWMHNLEDIVVTRLEGVYAGLQIKQIRKLQGTSLCDVCGSLFKQIPAGSAIIKHAISEIVCVACLSTIDKVFYDIDEIVDSPDTAPPIVPAENKKKPLSNYICICGEEFSDVESYTTHIQNCISYQTR